MPSVGCLKRWQSDHTCHHSHRFYQLATKSEKWNGKPRLECADGRHPPSKTPVGVLPSMPEWRDSTEQTDWRAKQSSEVACFSEDLKCWEAWDTTCGHKAKNITPLIVCRSEALKEEELDTLPWRDERGPSSIRRTLEGSQRPRRGNFWETGWSANGLFRMRRYQLELNWTEPAFYNYDKNKSDSWNTTGWKN